MSVISILLHILSLPGHSLNNYFQYKSDRPDILDVNNVTGQVFLNAALDREVTSFYSLPILAVDGGGRAARCNLRLRVNDQNDNSPNLDNLGEQISIYEATQPGQVIIDNIGLAFDYLISEVINIE